MTAIALGVVSAIGLAEPGQRVLILAGTPFGSPGSANILRLAYVPR